MCFRVFSYDQDTGSDYFGGCLNLQYFSGMPAIPDILGANSGCYVQADASRKNESIPLG